MTLQEILKIEARLDAIRHEIEGIPALLSGVLSHLGRRKTAAAHGFRTRQILTCIGWIPVSYAIFTNDFMHAGGYLHTCCENLGLSPTQIGKVLRSLRGLLHRCGAAAARVPSSDAANRLAHWHHKNATRMSAILAKLRSAA